MAGKSRGIQGFQCVEWHKKANRRGGRRAPVTFQVRLLLQTWRLQTRTRNQHWKWGGYSLTIYIQHNSNERIVLLPCFSLIELPDRKIWSTESAKREWVRFSIDHKKTLTWSNKRSNKRRLLREENEKTKLRQVWEQQNVRERRREKILVRSSWALDLSQAARETVQSQRA